MDFVVAMITRNNDRPVMSTHNAASWGYFDTVTSAWNTDILEQQGFPVNLLPRVVSPATDVGQLGDRPVASSEKLIILSLYFKRFFLSNSQMVWYPRGDPSECSSWRPSVLCNVHPWERDHRRCHEHFHLSSNGLCHAQRINTHSKSHPNTIEFLPYLDGHYISAAAALTGLFPKVIELWPTILE